MRHCCCWLSTPRTEQWAASAFYLGGLNKQDAMKKFHRRTNITSRVTLNVPILLWNQMKGSLSKKNNTRRWRWTNPGQNHVYFDCPPPPWNETNQEISTNRRNCLGQVAEVTLCWMQTNDTAMNKSVNNENERASQSIESKGRTSSRGEKAPLFQNL